MSHPLHIVVGLSGGVDSSVAAWLLQQQGHRVTGMFMINWHDTEGTLSGSCPWEDDLLLARLVARKLSIPLEVVDLSQSYRERVVDYMFSEYRDGRTPNPDVLCNREIKFDEFLRAALATGADYVATGHYCRKETFSDGTHTWHRLLAGADPGKDQSYFLCQLSQEQLSKALFPIGHMHKSQVRKIAEEQGLATARRKDSQGICFVGKVDLPRFLQQKLLPHPGPIVEIPAEAVPLRAAPALPEAGKLDGQPESLTEAIRNATLPYHFTPEMGIIRGKHNGAHYYTIGQRKGLHVGGSAEPLFVIATDTQNQVLYTGQGTDHPGLFRPGLKIRPEDIHWIRQDQAMANGTFRKMEVRIRYRQPLQKATLCMLGDGLYILFDQPQRGITPGQFAAWYEQDELMGSGVIC